MKEPKEIIEELQQYTLRSTRSLSDERDSALSELREWVKTFLIPGQNITPNKRTKIKYYNKGIYKIAEGLK